MITTIKAIILIVSFANLNCTQSSVRFGIRLLIIYGAILVFLSLLFHYKVYWHTFGMCNFVVSIEKPNELEYQ